MLTPRGLWFLVIDLFLLGLALWSNTPAMALLCLVALAWFLLTGLAFAVRLRLHLGEFRCTREVRDERGLVESLWVGRAFIVRITLLTEGVGAAPYLRASDRVPFNVKERGGLTGADGTVAPGRPLTFAYQFTVAAPGRVRFEGVRVDLADVQGFFVFTLFLREPREFRVLPALADVDGKYPTVKRLNLLPLVGQHRHRRPGSGSELLELRDYVEGDPPKMIAWKASARRDRLMTKEFESEVPVRCTLFVDQSASVRAGAAGQNALAHLTQLSAAVAQASAGARDLPGLCLFDEEGVRVLRPGRSRRHLIQIFSYLADAAGLPPAPTAAPPEALLPLAYSLAEEVYPDLLLNDVNRVPAWLPWFVPVPAWDRRPPRPGATVYLTAFLVLALAPALGVALVGVGLGYVLYSVIELLLGTSAAVAGAAAFGLAWVSTMFRRFEFVYRALPLFVQGEKRRLARMRKQLAALFSARYGQAGGGLALLLEDDTAFYDLLQRFLAEHRVPYPVPLYDDRGRFAFAAPAKLGVLQKALLQAVGRGRDNELFVLLADLIELDDQLGPVVQAVKVAVARHHQVVVLCPWPPGLPPPDAARGEDALPTLSYRELLQTPLDEALRRVTRTRYHRAFHRLRRAFTKLGVPVVCAAAGDAVQVVLDRMERLRGLQRRRR